MTSTPLRDACAVSPAALALLAFLLSVPLAVLLMAAASPTALPRLLGRPYSVDRCLYVRQGQLLAIPTTWLRACVTTAAAVTAAAAPAPLVLPAATSPAPAAAAAQAAAAVLG